MRIDIPCCVLGLAFVAIAPTAQAQTVFAPQPAAAVPLATTVVTQPERTVRTVTTVRTVRPLTHRRVAVKRHTYVSEHVVPSSTTTTTTTIASAPAVAAAYPSPPVYETAPVSPRRAPYYSEPLYDADMQTPTEAPAPAATAVPSYRYVYQSDRILVIDPNTGIAVQAIPR